MNRQMYFLSFCILFSVNGFAQTKQVHLIVIESVTPTITSIVPISCSMFDTIFTNKIRKVNINNKDKLSPINKEMDIKYAKRNDEIDVRGKIYFFKNNETIPFLEFCFDKFFTITHNGKVLNKKSNLCINLKKLLKNR